MHLVGELVTNKWLSDDLVIADISERGCICIACDEYYGTRRNFSTQLSSDFHSVHSRHGKIQDDEIDLNVSVQQL